MGPGCLFMRLSEKGELIGGWAQLRARPEFDANENLIP